MQKLNERLGDTSKVSPSLFVFYFYHGWSQSGPHDGANLLAGGSYGYATPVGIFRWGNNSNTGPTHTSRICKN